LEKKNIDPTWVNTIYRDLLKVIHDGFGGASQFRCYLVGRSFLNYLTKNFDLKFDDLPMIEALEKVLESIKKLGLISNFELSFNDPIIEFSLDNCVHTSVAKEVVKSKIPMFVCPHVNICLSLVEDKYGLNTEIMSFSNEGNTCKIKAILIK